jgi:hypothetical protein
MNTRRASGVYHAQILDEAKLCNLTGALAKYNGTKVTPVSSGQPDSWIVQLAPNLEGVVKTKNILAAEVVTRLKGLPKVSRGGQNGNNFSSTLIAVKGISAQVRAQAKREFQEVVKTRKIGFEDYTKELFHSFDKNKDGMISHGEFTAGLRVLNVSTTTDEVALVLPLFDKDGDGAIDYNEFCDLVYRDDMTNRTRKRSVYLPFLQRAQNLRAIALSTSEQRGKRIKERTKQQTKRLPCRSTVKLYASDTEPESKIPNASMTKQLNRKSRKAKARENPARPSPIYRHLPGLRRNMSGVFR